LSPYLSVLLPLALVASGMPKTLQTLHGNRACHHAAGRWLAEHARAGDAIVDPYCWAAYYAGEVFLEGKQPQPAPGYRPVAYVVSERRQDREHSRLATIPEAQIRAAGGTVVYQWPDQKAQIVIFAVTCPPLLKPEG
jgi:hypothetical protein